MKSLLIVTNLTCIIAVSGTTTNPCGATYRGSAPGSCLETQAVQDEIVRIGGTLSALVTVHTYGNYWLVPWGHQVDNVCVRTDDHEDLVSGITLKSCPEIDKRIGLHYVHC